MVPDPIWVQTKLLPPVKTFSNLGAASAGDTKAPGIRTASSRDGVNPVPSWAPQLPSQCWIQRPDPHRSPGDPASQRRYLETYPTVMATSLPATAMNPSQATALLRGKARQCRAGQQRSSLPADFCRPELNRAALRRCAEGNELVPYTDCFNSVTFMYWKLKPERCF